ncbi:MAG: PPC domain-containing protein [Planctomycetota bacterium]|nr:PPC domain-containing protein [Planctomycetota bacterium]MDA0919280.1 PPC domain-containing protein [Planctomycetota bacterium]
MPAFRTFRSLLAFVLLLSASTLFAASPRLSIILPRGTQRGKDAELTFSGRLLADVEEIMFYEPGFSVKEFKPVNANSFKAVISVSPDARLGEQVCQVRTKTGISDFQTFYVGYMPDIDEKEPNSDFATPQEIPMNVTVNGVANTEDVDYYVVEAKKGDRIAAEVEGMRLGTTLFDPYVAILDSKRFELAAADDSPLLVQDCVVSAIAPEDGKYTIEVRESSYGGNGNCRYRAHIGVFPRPTAVYPAGGKIGEEIEVKFIGDAAGEFTQKFTLPTEVISEYGLFAGSDGNWSPSWNTFRLSDVGNSMEVEPNNDRATASPAEFPTAFNGILHAAGDEDYFKFTATKGQQFEVECYGRRIRSAIDPVMYLYNAAGGQVAANDDSRGPDSYFRFNAPADGEYTLRVTDHLKRGGPDFVYRVEFQPIKPGLDLSIARSERYGQYRQQIFVGKGNRFGTNINLARRNFGGELVLAPKELPAGITMHHDKVPANMSVMPVVFEAAADAPLGGGLYDFTAHHAENPEIKGGFTNTSDFVYGAPGQSLYYTKTVDKLPIAVVDEIPFKLDIVVPKVPITRNGSMQLKIVATKKEGWDEPITIQFPFRPPGLGAGSSIQIPKGQTEGLYPLNANGSAAVGTWKVFAIGWAAVEGGNAFASSALTPLEISEPFVTFAMSRTACDQGQETEIACKLTQTKEFPGEAVAQIFGLPNKAIAEPMKFTKDTEEVIFKVKTDATTPAGRHKSVFGQVTITMNGEPIVHNVGSTELRVDVPLPPKVEPKPEAKPAAVAAAKPDPKPVVEAPPRRLTRLEMLRLEKAKAAAAGK